MQCHSVIEVLKVLQKVLESLWILVILHKLYDSVYFETVIVHVDLCHSTRVTMWLVVAVLKAAFRAEVQSVLRVLFMFIPLPLFHALFDQQVSRVAFSRTPTIRFYSQLRYISTVRMCRAKSSRVASRCHCRCVLSYRRLHVTTT